MITSLHDNMLVGSIAVFLLWSEYLSLENVTLLDGVMCSGDEQNLLNCTHSGYGVASPDCHHNHSLAGVQCEGIPQ